MTAASPSSANKLLLPPELFAYGCGIRTVEKFSTPPSSVSAHTPDHLKNPIFELLLHPPQNKPLPFPSLKWLHHIPETPSSKSSWYSVGFTGDAFLLRFQESADYLVRPDSNQIECRPNPKTNNDTLQHLLLNQVLPRLIAQQGSTILHASAVALEPQPHSPPHAIAFVGESGSGKSTLAAWFCKHDASFISDDCLRIKSQTQYCEHTPPLAIPAYPSTRFREDSRDQLIPNLQDRALSHHTSYNDKLCLQFEQFPFDFCNDALPLSAIYLLHPNKSPNQPLQISPASKAETINFLAANCFRLDIEDLALLKNEFFQLIHISKTVPTFRLDYPKNWETLENLRPQVLQHLNALTNLYY